jgi:hypothetical protein
VKTLTVPAANTPIKSVRTRGSSEMTKSNRIAAWTLVSIVSIFFFLLKNPLHPRADVYRVGVGSKWREDAYYIREANWHHADKHGEGYILEHKGHVLFVRCRESRTYSEVGDTPDISTRNPYELMDDTGCTYMQSWIGKYISDGLVFRVDSGELWFCPWFGENTIQTADILDVEQERPQ